MAGERAGKSSTPRTKGAEVRISATVLYLAAAGLVVLVILVRVVSFSAGKSAGIAQAERELGVLSRAATPTDPLNEAGAPQDRAATPGPSTPAASKDRSADARPAPAGSKTGTARPGTAITEAGVNAGRGAFLTATGRSETDPRQSGENYLILAIIGEDEAAAAVAFLNSNGLPAFAAPNRGDRRAATGRATYQLIALQGLSSAQLRRNESDKRSIEQTAAKLGAAWKASKAGTIDFAQAYWAKFDR